MATSRLEFVLLTAVIVLVLSLLVWKAWVTPHEPTESGKRAPEVVVSTSERPDVSRTTRQFHDILRECDRVRVLPSAAHLGGRTESAEARFTVEGTADVELLTQAILIDDDRSGGVCACRGYALIEFRRDGRAVMGFTFHHGRKLRFCYGERPRAWRDDAYLLPESQLSLCRWLADHGEKGPLQELIERRRGLEILELRERRYRDILPPRTWEALPSHEVLGEVLEQTIGDPEERVRLLLGLYGCHPGTWTHYAGWDPTICKLLEATPVEALALALRDPDLDLHQLDGLARALFNDRALDQLHGIATQHLSKLGRAGVTHPDQENRRRSMAGIGRFWRSPAAIDLLRSVLAGSLPHRETPEAWRNGNPGGYVSSAGLGAEVRDPTSDRIVAAWLLADLGDRESLNAIRALESEVQTPEDAAVLGAAIKLLE